MTMKFFVAALKGDTATLRSYILEHGMDVNMRARELVEYDTVMWEGINRTALHFACLAEDDEDNLETVMMLLELGADLNAQTDNGDTPLHYAGVRGLDQIATKLILAGANPCVKNYEGPISDSPDNVVRAYEETRFDFVRAPQLDLLLYYAKYKSEEEEKWSPAKTPYEFALCFHEFSTTETLLGAELRILLLRVAEEIYKEHGKVTREMFFEKLKKAEEECEEEQVQFDARHGFNESTSFVMPEHSGYRVMEDFDQDVWKKMCKDVNFDEQAFLQQELKHMRFWEKMKEVNLTFNFTAYQTPPNVNALQDDYGDDIPIAARTWAKYSR
ncbi:hypothetical protein GUITHDRAFT_146056 [Guillardia theta CCMP2712]|uniref:Uncharacterized protein n=1 Tax=Guillardia theta (strain CCMP2712) TaxID=905079 RepID=L1IIG0_GUITC|nr:hypothetical protein GUITHDRAFT_146056 [Guillardia theta CCMP2712]EKX36016.1 hypothetical protein GUITHDRAFT_146056 [Guillardia theta CCMP2712]|eukprot:XP_005822996.1 hypothetical protein GUITHDRAFT_146056 [Guillardia theta CCMP2712]